MSREPSERPDFNDLVILLAPIAAILVGIGASFLPLLVDVGELAALMENYR